MRKFIDWLATCIPYVWSIAIITLITTGLVAFAIKSVEWLLELLGVL